MSNDKHHEDCSLHNAPSQPAGAIEFGLDAAVGEIIRQVYGPYASTMNADERKTARDTLSEIVSRYARQQTAAKDAEIVWLRKERHRHVEALEAAERERDRSREALTLAMNYRHIEHPSLDTKWQGSINQAIEWAEENINETHAPGALAKRILTETKELRELAALKAGKDGQK